ncbi:MAG TPA: CAP domain-containing protein [Thermoanaerobaculia bacterium]
MKVARWLATPLLAAGLLGWAARMSSGLLAAAPEPRPLALRAPSADREHVETYPTPEQPRDAVKLAVFEKINADRLAAGLATVAWDESASRVADAFSAQQVAERTRGHFLMDGLPPYARTAFASIFGKGSENSVSWLTTASSFSEPTVNLALSGQKDMITERPPNDGHRRTILSSDATHVGVGYAIDHGRFQMAEEFLVRHLERLSWKITPGAVPNAHFEGRTRPRRAIRFVTIAWEPVPRHLTREEASARTSYAYPKPFLSYIPEGQHQWRVLETQNQDRLSVRRDDSFSFVFSPPQQGLYTFVFYTSSPEASDPRPGGSATLWFE